MMWWAVWSAVLLACSTFTTAAPASVALTPMDLVQIDTPVSDDETFGYAVPSIDDRFSAGAPWVYFIAGMPRETQVTSNEMPTRSRRSFSVNPAIEILQRGIYNHYMEKVAQNNRNYLNRVGKREPAGRSIEN